MQLELRVPPWGKVGDRLFSPSQAQYRYLTAPEPYSLFLGGVGSGKTHTGARKFLHRVLGGGGPYRYWVGAPSYAILRDATWPAVIRYLDELSEANGYRIDRKRYKTEPRRIELVTGAEISFIPLDEPERYAGATLAGFWIDEADLVKHGRLAWNMLTQRLREGRVAQRWALVTTTPRWQGEVVSHFLDRVAKGDRDYSYVRSRTEDNPSIPPGYVETMRAGMSRREIAQQLEAEALAPEGSIYGDVFCPRASMAPDWRWRGPRDHCLYYIAVDWGVKFPHVLWIEYDPLTDTDVVFDELCEDQVHHRDLCERVKARSASAWELPPSRIAKYYVDENPRDALLEAYAAFRRGVVSDRPVFSEHQDPGEWEYGIETVSWRLFDQTTGRRRLLFAPRLHQTPSRRRILECLRRYRWLDGSSGGSRVLTDRIEKGLYDHGADALRYYIAPKHRASRWSGVRLRAVS